MTNTNNEFLTKLAQYGFAACFRGMPNQAIDILEGVSAVRPDNDKVLTALAVAYMNANRLNDAITLFRKALRTDPANATAKSFLGLTLKLLGENSESEALLRDVATSSSNQQSNAFAKLVLNSDVRELAESR